MDVYITGSNAFFLSGELATLLTGRYVEKRVMPFSFAEYCQARNASHEENTSIESLFDDYLTYGGLPLTATFHENESLIHDYLAGVFSTIINVDIAQRAPQMNMRMILDTASFLADNIGNISSLKSISNSLKASGRSISPTSIAEYIDILLENFLLYKARRFDVKGKEYLHSLEKYYLGDLGLRFWLLGKNNNDIGHTIENLVYLELLRSYGTVDIGKVDRNKIDFVTRSGDNVHYFQIATTVLDEHTRERELKPLRAIKDNHPKFLLTLDRIGLGSIDGITHRNLIDWLMKKE
ncbi:MAG: ATP-binding protein [Actinomycetaceae bacterium]|nr:ATP-binding protein [Actinomycetaceae bacterium]